jgi:peptide/nickel transport system permease protein
VGLVIGLISGYVRWLDGIVMRIMDGLMSIPAILLAIALASTPSLLARHVLPNTIAPLVVQGTFVCASAIVVEAILSFLGIGIPPETPTWGNIMAEGRALFRIFPHNILFPSIFLAATVLGVNMLGDGLRDLLDPRVRKQI